MVAVNESRRYEIVADEKAAGATYTPQPLASFVAQQILSEAASLDRSQPLRLLDPAVGDGELLLALLSEFYAKHESARRVEVYGFETDDAALQQAETRIRKSFPEVSIEFQHTNFLEFVLNHFDDGLNRNLFRPTVPNAYDLIIANPPYVRTQIMGAAQARLLAEQFGLSGRVDLYYAFVVAMARVLKPEGTAGFIVSNRFMTTKAGGAVRAALLEQLDLQHVWDLGDTKLFEAAVLPAVLVARGRNSHAPLETPRFSSIYEVKDSSQAEASAVSPLDALSSEGLVRISDGRRFAVKHGSLSQSEDRTAVWRIATEAVDKWLATVNQRTWGTFKSIGKVRVGVKTCADKVFIRSDWDQLEPHQVPELLRPIITHHTGRRFRARPANSPRQILYPHDSRSGRRETVDISAYPQTQAYLEDHRSTLEKRQYVLDAGRQWYEIWVPQDPAAWSLPKLVFRDISEQPTFWVDLDGSVVNGDCYWIAPRDATDASLDLVWLAAAVANSTFIEHFYDHSFNNKLYAGRRRFITQYVEQFPLPDPSTAIAKTITALARDIYQCLPTDPKRAEALEKKLDALVWKAFGLIL